MSRIQRCCTLAGAVGLIAGNLLTGQAQTVIGMGTENPNPNAVLELVPENGNQGFLAPRLTSTQRTSSSFTNKLTDADNGLLVFDVDQGAFFYWYQNEWRRGVRDDSGSGNPASHGTTWFTGSAAPTAIQADEGDFYINEATGEVYKFREGAFVVIGSIGESSGSNPAQDLSSVLQRSNNASEQKITNLGNPTDPGDAATKAYVDTQIGSVSFVDTDTDEQDLKDVLLRGNNAEGNSISNLADPANDQDAATKKYVDDEIDGLLPLFGTDNQNLTFNTTTKKLSIENGNEVDLSTLGALDLPAGQLFIGNASNQAIPVTITGDITIAADGSVTIGNASISTDKIQDAAITTDKIAAAAVGKRKIKSNVAGNGLAQAVDGSLEVNLGGDVVTVGDELRVVKLRNNELAAIAPTDGQVLQWDSGNAHWVPVTLSGAGTDRAGTWYSGANIPNATNPVGALNGDFYLRDNPTMQDDLLLYKRAAGSWQVIGKLIDPAVANTSPITLSGMSEPSGLNGKVGDFYIREDRDEMFMKIRDDGPANDRWKRIDR